MNFLVGRRVALRPLTPQDFPQWHEVRKRNRGWLLPWQPDRPSGARDYDLDPRAFAELCNARLRERQQDTGYGFGLFVGGRLIGEVNVSHILRGPFQSGSLGYWIDRLHSGQGYMTEGVVVLLRYCFEELRLHRVQAAVMPMNQKSRAVMERLGVRQEGLAQRYILVGGQWEDHILYAITAEEWQARRRQLLTQWLW